MNRTLTLSPDSLARQRLWHWRALDPQGNQQQGHHYAPQRADIALHLQHHSLYPLAIRLLPIHRRHWRTPHRLHFIRQLATLLKAGIPLNNALHLLAQQHPLAQWRALASHLAERLQQGITFAAAARQWPAVFPPLFIALIDAGERTGKLDHCCQQLADQQARQWQIEQKTRKALRYPVFILLFSALICTGMIAFVLPQFAAIYQSFDAPLPAITRALLQLSDLITAHPLAILASLAASFGALRASRRQPAIRQLTGRALRHTPLIRPLLQAQRLSQIHTILALCQQTGIPLLQALQNAIHTQTCPHTRKALAQIAQQISEGQSFSQAIARQPLFTDLCRQLIHTGEASGTLDHLLAQLANWHSEQAAQQADKLTAALEPAMMLIVGFITAALLLAMYLPIFQLGDALNAG